MPLQGVSQICFGFSYFIALAMELLQQFWPRTGTKWIGSLFGVLGLLMHTLFLLFRQPSPADPDGSLVLLAWPLAAVYVYANFHSPHRAWAIFVLPVVLVLVTLSLALVLTETPITVVDPHVSPWPTGERLWGLLHGSLFMLGAAAMSIGFLASLMYLVQAYRLRNKMNPLGGLRLLSLERLESLNRRAVNWAFPLLTAGLMLGAILMRQHAANPDDWAALKIVSTTGLWLVSILLMYLCYGTHVAGRRLAWLTVAAFGLMLLTLIAAHPPVVSGDPR